MSDLTRGDLEAARRHALQKYPAAQPKLTQTQASGIQDYLSGVKRGRRKARESFEKTRDVIKRLRISTQKYREALRTVKTLTKEVEVVNHVNEALDTKV